MKGEIRVMTIASCQEKTKQIRHEMKMPRKASTMIPIASVVKPLTELMSSVMILVRMPGALSLLSNQPTCFLRIASKSLILNLKVKLSPPKPKHNFWVKLLRPIPTTSPMNAQVQISRSC